MLGFDRQDNTRIATAVSEIVRNAFEYAGGGKVEFSLEIEGSQQTFVICVADDGAGIKDLPEILNGAYKSATGMGLGITGARRLMDVFTIESAPHLGTVVRLGKKLPKHRKIVDAAGLREIADALAQTAVDDPFEEIQEQNQELLRTLERLNMELEETNRGVVALYAELNQTAQDLRRADLGKTAFLANLSHEFRTPLNSQLALTGILLDSTDGELAGEQETQVRLIRRGTETLLDLVNDLLDLAKIAAGKTIVNPSEFTIEDLFSVLRGMIRPLVSSDRVRLIFDEPIGEIRPLVTDEGKVAQILRNLLSNALKFTVCGEVRVAAEFSSRAPIVIFTVADTGIGVAPENQTSIFEEFAQINNDLQKNHKGTGLG